MSEKTPNIEKITARKASDPKAPEQKATGAKKKLDPKKKKWLIAGIALLLVAAVAVTAVVLHKRRGDYKHRGLVMSCKGFLCQKYY